LSFSYCSIPFLYQKDGKEGMEIHFIDGAKELIADYKLNASLSTKIFNRNANMNKVVVHF
jgi:hypothetical protein